MSNYTTPPPKDRMMIVDVTPKGESRTYERVGKGFDSATPSTNTQTKVMQWLDEKNGSTALTTKSIQKAISGQRAVGDPFNDYFCSMFDKVGADAETTMILVDAWNEETETPGTYKAKKYNVVVDCTNDGGGAVADGLLIEGIIYVNGDPVEGTFVEATKTFTEGMAE